MDKKEKVIDKFSFSEEEVTHREFEKKSVVVSFEVQSENIANYKTKERGHTKVIKK